MKKNGQRFTHVDVVAIFLIFVAVALCVCLCGGFSLSAQSAALLSVAQSVLPWLGLVAAVLALAAAFLPQNRETLPSCGKEKTGTALYWVSLFGLSVAGNLPLFLLEELAVCLMPVQGAAAASDFPMLRYGLLPWAFTALLMLTWPLCTRAKSKVWFRIPAALCALCGATALFGFTAPVMGASLAAVPALRGLNVGDAWMLLFALALYAALLLSGKGRFASLRLWAVLALSVVFLTGSGLVPLLRAGANAALAVVRSVSVSFSAGEGALETQPHNRTAVYLAYWLCLSPLLAPAALRVAQGRAPRRAALDFCAAGFGGCLVLCAVFGAYGLRLRDSLAQAGLSAFEPCESLADSVAKLFAMLPFPGMCVFLLTVALLLTTISALDFTGGETARLCGAGEGEGISRLVCAGLCALPATVALFAGQAERAWRAALWGAIPATLLLAASALFAALAVFRRKNVRQPSRE